MPQRVAVQHRLQRLGSDDGGHREHEGGESVGVGADEAEPAIAVGMGRDQAQLEAGEVAQQQSPHQMPPQPAQQQEPEQRQADDGDPPAGQGEVWRAARPWLRQPG